MPLGDTPEGAPPPPPVAAPPPDDPSPPGSPSPQGTPRAVQVLFSRYGVSVRPTPTSRIPGRFSLLCCDGALFLAWIPSQKPLKETDKEDCIGAAAYALHPIPLCDVRAVRPHTPPLRQHTLTIVLRSGATLPPFYFLQGGVRALLSALRQHAALSPAPDDPGALVVNDPGDPLTKSLTALQLADAVTPPVIPSGGPESDKDAFSWPLALWQVEDGGGSGGEASGSEEGPSVVEQLREFAEKVGRMTQGARMAASSFLAGSTVIGDAASSALDQLGRATVAAGGGDPWPLDSNVHKSVERTEEEDESAAEESPAAEPPPPLPPSPSHSLSGWELIEREVRGAGENRSWDRPRPPPLTVEEFLALEDNEGRLTSAAMATLRERAFSGGVDPIARPLVWSILLGVRPPESTATERTVAAAGRLKLYLTLRRQWVGITAPQEARFSKWREHKVAVDKDWRRTDRSHPFYKDGRGQAATMLRRILLTHVMWNFDLGYVQGMSDLAAPLLVVARRGVADFDPGEAAPLLPAAQQAEVEAEAFWMFAALMDRLGDMFSTDSGGMQAQLTAARRLLAQLDPPLHAHFARRDAASLFYCYRWFLIMFKREFAFDEVPRLWEALWARPGDQLHLFLAVAMLCRQRRRILEEDLGFDGILELCVSLAGKVDLEAALRDAERLHEAAGEAGRVAVAGLPLLAAGD